MKINSETLDQRERMLDDIDEFYNLSNDPYETINLIKEDNAKKDEFKQHIIN